MTPHNIFPLICLVNSIARISCAVHNLSTWTGEWLDKHDSSSIHIWRLAAGSLTTKHSPLFQNGNIVHSIIGEFLCIEWEPMTCKGSREVSLVWQSFCEYLVIGWFEILGQFEIISCYHYDSSSFIFTAFQWISLRISLPVICTLKVLLWPWIDHTTRTTFRSIAS